jgi:hypothetical protein
MRHRLCIPFCRIYDNDMMNTTSRLYFNYAVALLVPTVLAGALLRAALAWPQLGRGLHAPFVMHAHSHAGFFGWAVLGVAAALTARSKIGPRARLTHAVLAHLIGVASLAAFVGFALRGYDMTTIAISAVHVFLWMVLVAALWQTTLTLPDVSRQTVRTGLLFLVGAGLGTMAPVTMMIRGTTDPWLLGLGVKLFLTPFVTGFLVLAALGLLHRQCGGSRAALAATAAIAVGTLPSTLLYVPGSPPWPWLLLAGRAGMGLVGGGMLFFAIDVLRSAASRRTSGIGVLPALLLASVTATAIVKLLAAAGVGAAFMHNRGIVIAVLHLVLLGVVTPALLMAVRPAPSRARAAVYAGGLAVMLASVAGTGWPWAARALAHHGVAFDALLLAAAVGGMLATLALLTLVFPSPASPDSSRKS